MTVPPGILHDALRYVCMHACMQILLYNSEFASVMLLLFFARNSQNLGNTVNSSVIWALEVPLACVYMQILSVHIYMAPAGGGRYKY